MRGNHFSHDPLEDTTHALNISSKIWFTCSVCPEVCGWYAELLISLVPKALCKCSQKQAINYGPWSEIMVLGTPCNLTIWETYSSAYFPMGYFMLIGTKRADLVRQSTMNHMESWPCCVYHRELYYRLPPHTTRSWFYMGHCRSPHQVRTFCTSQHKVSRWEVH